MDEGMVGDMGMVEATEEVAGAIMLDTLTAMAITGDMDMVGRVTLIGGTTVTIPIIIILGDAGVLDTGQICPLLGQGFGCLAGGFHAIKSRALLQTQGLISRRC